ncbi:MAG: RluA family pseudouridine synthase [Eubacteriales bacterium]|nr:RluA family pseudouridine synthase [Eubacteriales bacterium]
MSEFLAFETIVEPNFANLAAKDFLARRFKLSRSRIKAIRLRGALFINGQKRRMIDRVKAGDHLRAVCPDLSSPELRLDALASSGAEIAYQDPWLLVIRKPAGILVHPSYQEDYALTTLISAQSLHPIRRLDKDTSGLVPIGLNPHVHEQLQGQKSIKAYRVLVHGRLPQSSITIRNGIQRNPLRSIQRIAGGEENLAISHFREWAYFPKVDVSLLDVQLESGRTHQIRAHALYLGLPLLGDWLYGRSALDSVLQPNYSFYSLEARLRLEQLRCDHFLPQEAEFHFTRQALDADYLEFTNPYDAKLIKLSSDWPDDFKAFFARYELEPGPRPERLYFNPA